MNARPLEHLAVAAAPGLFVVLWASGFVGARLGMPYAEPLTFLALRMLAVVGVLVVVIAVTLPPRPGGARLAHNAVAGLLVHGFYLGGVFVAIDRGLATGLVALVVGLQPLLTSTVADRFLGERVTARQWAGLLLGLAGIAMVVSDKTAGGDVPALAWASVAISLVSITAGTLYQKRFGGGIDWRTGFLCQYLAAATLLGLGALLLEARTVQWTAEFVFAVGWLVFVLSFGAVWLLYFMIRRTAATRVASLFYLTPPTTALMAWLLFDERLAPLAVAGMAACAAGVFLVNRAR